MFIRFFGHSTDMVQLVSGYVITPEVGIKIADKLGMDPAKNNKCNARMHINRYIKEKNPRFPTLYGIEYPSFARKREFAYILATRVDDDNPKAKFEERPGDLEIKRDFMALAGIEESDLTWDTVLYR